MKPNTNVEDEELRKKIRDEWLIHEEDCQYSMFDIPCDCIQDDVSKNIMQLIAARERKAEAKAKHDILVNFRSTWHTLLRQDVLTDLNERIERLGELTSTKDKS